MSRNTSEAASFSQAENLDSDLVNTNTDGECWILGLNDECLEYICKKLPISDQINFALACERFFNIMEIILRGQHVLENTFKFYDWSPERIKNYFQVIGPQIKHLNINYLPKNTLLDVLIARCRNVLKLTLACSNLDNHLMIRLMNNMEKIEEFEIYKADIDDWFMESLKKFKRLRVLTVKSNHKVTGKYIERLKDLEKLTIHYCHQLTMENLNKICTKLINLRHLDVLYTRFSKPQESQIIATNLLQLETLKVSGSLIDLNCLTEVPKLKTLTLKMPMDNANFFNTLGLNQLNKLELISHNINKEIISAVTELKNLKVLRISCWNIIDEFFFIISKLTELEELNMAVCNTISDISILEILKKCLKLKRLKLEHCDRLTPALLEEAVKLLKKQHADHQRKDLIVITGTYSAYRNKLLNNLHLVNDFPDLIKISLEEENDSTCEFSDSDSEYNLIWE